MSVYNQRQMPSRGENTSDVFSARVAPAEFLEPLARLASQPGGLATRVLWFDEVGSTNDVAVALARSGSPHGLVVAADLQHAGRGRLGRRWASPAGAGLYVSVILRPPSPTALLTLAAGVGVANGLHAATGLDVDLKWPNDLQVRGRKIAGILAEGGTGDDGENFVVMGVGINVLSAAFPADVAARATSLESELGRPVDRGVALAETLAALGTSYGDVVEGRTEKILREWRQRARRTLGRAVEWDEAGQTLRGVARDIDETGALVIDAESGARRVMSGEVRWC